MSYVALLLDKAKNKVSPANYSTLAVRLGVTRQLVSLWKNGHDPLPDERIAQLARIAGEDAGEWLVAIHHERAHGEARRAWSALAHRLGTAAALATVALYLSGHPAALMAAAIFPPMPIMFVAAILTVAGLLLFTPQRKEAGRCTSTSTATGTAGGYATTG